MLTKKTKIWIGVFAIAIIALSAITVFISKKGYLFRGIAVEQVANQRINLVLAPNIPEKHPLPATDATLFGFTLKNSSDAPLTLTGLRIVRSEGSSLLLSEVENVRLVKEGDPTFRVNGTPFRLVAFDFDLHGTLEPDPTIAPSASATFYMKGNVVKPGSLQFQFSGPLNLGLTPARSLYLSDDTEFTREKDFLGQRIIFAPGVNITPLPIDCTTPLDPPQERKCKFEPNSELPVLRWEINTTHPVTMTTVSIAVRTNQTLTDGDIESISLYKNNALLDNSPAIEPKSLTLDDGAMPVFRVTFAGPIDIDASNGAENIFEIKVRLKETAAPKSLWFYLVSQQSGDFRNAILFTDGILNPPLNGNRVGLYAMSEEFVIPSSEAPPQQANFQAMPAPPQSGVEVTKTLKITSEPITLPPSGTIQPGTETAVLSFGVEAEAATTLKKFTFSLTFPDTTIPNSYFQNFTLKRGNAEVISVYGPQLTQFQNSGNLVLDITNKNETLLAGPAAKKIYTLFVTLASNAPASNSFKIQLDSIQTNPQRQINSRRPLPLVSAKFTTPGAPAPPAPPPDTQTQQQIQALQQQIQTLTQQLSQAQRQQDTALTRQIAQTLQSLIAAQTQAIQAAQAQTQAQAQAQAQARAQAQPQAQAAQIQARAATQEPKPRRPRFTPGLLDYPEYPQPTVVTEQPPQPPPPPSAPPLLRPVAPQELGVSPAITPGAAAFGVAPTPTLVSAPRLRFAPERGDTGPGVLLYPLVWATASGLYFWRKRNPRR